jgi:DNA-binding IclR family transcriptional regulator
MKANNKIMLAEMMARMEADNKAWQEKMRAETEAIRAETEATRAATEAIQARTEAMREGRMKANINACIADIKNDRKEMTACQDAMEANLETMEPNPEKTRPQ